MYVVRQHGVSAWGNVRCYECSNFTSLPVRVLMKLRTEIPPERQAVTIKMEQYTLWKYFAQNQCKVGEERVYVQVGHVECKWNNAMISSRLWLLNFTHAPHIIAFKPMLVNASFVCQYLCNAIFPPYWANIFFPWHPVTPLRFTSLPVRVLMKMRAKIPPERQAVAVK